jgi:hypothetical protein
MLAGHIGAALAIGRAERRINLGVIVSASLLLDFALWLFVLLGWESVTIPANFATERQLAFVFPYSHSLLAAATWSTLAGVATFLWYPRLGRAKLRAAAFVAAAVFSHWLLDLLVHVPELPLAGKSTLKVGLGMWQNLPLALAVEAFITLVGLCLFLSGSNLSRVKKFWITALSLSILIFTMVGMTVAPPPPSEAVAAASSLAIIVIVCALTGWLGKRAT